VVIPTVIWIFWRRKDKTVPPHNHETDRNGNQRRRSAGFLSDVQQIIMPGGTIQYIGNDQNNITTVAQ
jgi:hypothetical protein